MGTVPLSPNVEEDRDCPLFIVEEKNISVLPDNQGVSLTCQSLSYISLSESMEEDGFGYGRKEVVGHWSIFKIKSDD